ncbi:hypothetical protein P9112_007843 [Eukaryota sp. TZLM1-RC]
MADTTINVTSSKDSPSKTTRSVSLIQLWRLYPRHKVLLYLGSILCFISGLAMPLFARLFGDIFEAFTLPSDEIRGEVFDRCIRLAILGVVFFILNFPGTAMLGYLAEHVLYSIRVKLFGSLIEKPSAFFDNHQLGTLVNKISDDCAIVHKGVGEKPAQVVFNFGQFLFAMILAFYENWRVTGALLLLSPILIVTGAMESRMTEMAAKNQSDVKGKAYSIVQQSLDGITTVKSYTAKEGMLKKYLKAAVVPLKLGIKKSKLEGFTVASMFGLMMLVYAGSLYISGVFIANGTASAGDVAAVFLSVMMGIMALGNLGGSLGPIAKAKASASSVYELIEAPADDLNESGIIKELKGHLKIENVTFRYPTRQDVTVLKNFSLEIEPNTTVAFVGTSGGGKSTIINLLQKFYDPEEGNVIVDGIPLTDLNLTAFRRQVALVEQHPKLFSGTIKENILFGLFGTGLEYSQPELENKVIDAAKKANAFDFITSLPNGFDTELNEGTELSGGQLQRISIARALIREPKVLLLDEPTSALDSESERMVQEVLEEMMTSLSCTMIIIAHRLSTVRNADKIAVINRGLIAEGTHEELLANSEAYQKLTSNQLIGFANSEDSE